MKLLLLGAGESGKSTIAKQMKIIHLRGFTDSERAGMREIIWSNMVQAIKTLAVSTQLLGFSVEKPENELRRAALAEAPVQVQAILPPMAADMKALWADKGVQLTFKSRHLFQLSDSCDYFLDNIDRISSASYLPTEADVLRARVKTTGIQEIVFAVDDVSFCMVDVGGQRSERKKWIHCFQDVTVVIFCVAMSEYDLKLYEDETVGRTDESLKLFDEICNSKWFFSTPIVLFLNKKDLFAEKIKRVDLSKCFPEYQGGSDYNAASKFLEKKFLNLNRNFAKQIYSHQTCGTDTANVKIVFNAVKDIFFQDAFKAHGM